MSHACGCALALRGWKNWSQVVKHRKTSSTAASSHRKWLDMRVSTYAMVWFAFSCRLLADIVVVVVVCRVGCAVPKLPTCLPCISRAQQRASPANNHSRVCVRTVHFVFRSQKRLNYVMDSRSGASTENGTRSRAGEPAEDSV